MNYSLYGQLAARVRVVRGLFSLRSRRRQRRLVYLHSLREDVACCVHSFFLFLLGIDALSYCEIELYIGPVVETNVYYILLVQERLTKILGPLE